MKHQSVRDAFLFAALICIAITNGWGAQQQPEAKPSVSDLLTKLHSRYWSERSDALDEIGSDQALLHSKKVKAALLDLLDQENQGKHGSPKEANSESGEADGGEEYAEYFASLREVVNSFADWNDPRQACILVYAGSNDYPSPQQAAARARAVMPCILKRSKSEDALDRAVAAPMLVEAVQKAQGTLDATTAQTAKQAILSNLHDPDEGVRGFTVDALGKFGGMDMIPALKQVAANDPSPEVGGNSIRRSAAEAVAEIQKREAQR
jgi:HEAT repeat protein